MNSEGAYHVYILASRHHGTMYIGITNDIRKRLDQHRSGQGSKFVRKYGVFRLVHIEAFATPQEAIAREKQLKFWKRDWKIRLIETENPDWEIGHRSFDSRGNGSWLSPGRPREQLWLRHYLAITSPTASSCRNSLRRTCRRIGA